MGSGFRVWRSSEGLAARLLESMGFKVTDTHRRIIIDGIEVGEVDIVAEKNGEFYAVEVKAGGLDVSGVRQAYVNALLLGMKPMIVSRGYSDESAKRLAEELGVEVVVVPDVIVSSTDDLRLAVEEAVWSAIQRLLVIVERCLEGGISDSDLRVLEVIASSDTFLEAAERLGVDERSMARIVASLRSKGLLPQGGYRGMRSLARVIVSCVKMRG